MEAVLGEIDGRGCRKWLFIGGGGVGHLGTTWVLESGGDLRIHFVGVGVGLHPILLVQDWSGYEVVFDGFQSTVLLGSGNNGADKY